MKKRVLCRILATVLATSLVSAGFTLHTFATEIGPETLLSESEEEDPALEPQEEAAEEDSLTENAEAKTPATTENPAQISEAETEESQTEEPQTEEPQGAETEEAVPEEAETERAAAYEGITLDGDFSDWDAVAKTEVADGHVQDIAMVFDGEYVYIYISEPQDSYWQVATGAGVTGDGKFVITTDTGKQSVFYLRQDRITDRNWQTITGTSLTYKDKRYEICLPASFVKAYNQTISLGYYEGEQLISGVANLQGHSNSQVPENGGDAVEYGDGFADWKGYPHTTIAYSTTDAEGSAALYTKGSTLYIHEITSNAVDVGEYAGNLTPFTICLNGADKNDWNQLMGLKLISADANGNTTDNGENDLSSLEPGEYDFYVGGIYSWGYWGWNVNNSFDINRPIYGKAKVRVTETGYEMECTVDLETLAAKYADIHQTAFSASDIKQVEVQFGDIGQQWVTWSGTSTGPWIGVLLALLLASFAGWRIFRKEQYSIVRETV